MAGGEGAKERRRLKRLAVQEEKERSAQATAKERPNGDRFGRQALASSDVNRRKASNGQQRPNEKNRHRMSNGNANKTLKKGKKNKIKKPKHLKRKLEQISNEDEQEAKEVIERRIKEFEANKKLYSKRKKNDKNQKRIGSHNGDDSNITRRNKVVSRLNEINDNISLSQSREKVETKKPVDIEDVEDDMKDHRKRTESNYETRNIKSTTMSCESEEDSISDGTDDENLRKDESNKSSKYDNSIIDQSTSGSDNDSDDDTGEYEPVQQRRRGRRRHGREDTAKKIEEMKAIEKMDADTNGEDESNSKRKDKSTTDGKKRYCTGRKPVTDFIIGQSLEGKVVYVKSFGVFFDIGCHSDAFCHVSRLSDDFIKSPESKFKDGDVVPKVRIIEIDRKQKRITVSLQSDARIEDERHSIEARELRKGKRKQKSKKAPSVGISGHDHAKMNSRLNGSTTSFANGHDIKRDVSIPMTNDLDESKMTPAELKRARKLARRAERRVQATKSLDQ